jgi:hypothetical protein
VYQIPVGLYYTGSAMHLVFVNDDDSNAGSNSIFSNVRLFEVVLPPTSPVIANPGNQNNVVSDTVSLNVLATDVNEDVLVFSATGLPPGLNIATGGTISGTPSTVGTFNVEVTVSDGNGGSDTANFVWTVQGAVCAGCLNFNSVVTQPFAGQDQHGTTAVENGGATLLLSNNTWRSTVQTFNITPQTVVEFDFESTSQAERTGIGFAVNDTIEANRMFKVYGTQSVSWDIKTFHNYTGGVKHYTIPVGQYYTGTAMNMVFFNDYDVGNGLGTNGRFSNVRIINAPGN